jgi:hypothetical protein
MYVSKAFLYFYTAKYQSHFSREYYFLQLLCCISIIYKRIIQLSLGNISIINLW